MKPIDLMGQRFGRLGVLRKATRKELDWPLRDESSSFWHCECACGTACIVRGSNLARGITRSCGCYRRDRALKMNSLRWGRRRPDAEGLDLTAPTPR